MIGAQNLVYANPMGPYAEDPRQAELRRILERMRGQSSDEFGTDPTQVALPGGMSDPMAALGQPAPAVFAPAPADPLELEIPNAPAPVDVAGIRKEEMDALTAERGPRIKKNPKGLKGFLLGLAKGAAGLAEGYGRSGARDFMDALPSMVQGASGRIEQYQTNREDYEPFDRDLNDRMRQRIEPLIAKYGQDRQRYGDLMDRYGVEQKNRDDADTRAFRDSEAKLRREQFESLDADRKADNDRLERVARTTAETQMARIQATTRLGLARLTDARQKGVAQAETRELDKRWSGLATTERDLLAQRRTLQSQLGRSYGIYGKEKPAVDDPKVNAARQRLAEIEDQLEELQAQKSTVLERYATIADVVGGRSASSTGGAGVTDAAKALSLIDRAEKAGKITAEDARKRRAAVQARAGGR